MVKVLVSMCKANKGEREREKGLATKVRIFFCDGEKDLLTV
jgi:hypothetical protein